MPALPASVRTTILYAVHSNLFISLATVSVAVTTARLVGLPLEPLPLFLVFAATMFVYSINRITDLAEDERNVPRRAAFTKRYGRRWLALGVALYVLAILVAVAAGVPGAGYLLLPLVAAVLYSMVGLKRVFLVKNCFVGAAWGVIPLGVGYYYDVLASPGILFLAAYVFAMITVAAVVFDVKDIEGDREEGIATVPIVVGPRWTRISAQVANVAIAAGVVAVVAADLLEPSFLVVLAMNAYVATYIPFATPDRTPLYYGFVVDGEHVFLAAVVLVADWLTVL
ncbi:UbiA family prenyltransferase [Halopiger goleimassiliensis]|uniref:UbiA family prenyltransferase n=1 Tax=Halopiger goleimassiliensis TaxID=1293048 RepID=UPI001E578DDB|nr:UbiA family prenyltransferase [Halopiger goleimassiliensis]